MDYACFGDVVSFDTTFQTNNIEMPFAPLIGTNHHKQTIIFGCALLFNETIDSFVWLFEKLLKRKVLILPIIPCSVSFIDFSYFHIFYMSSHRRRIKYHGRKWS